MEKTEEEYQHEVENAYLDCRVAFHIAMMKEGHSEEYIEGRLKWLDEMYGDSLKNMQNIIDSVDGKGCDI